MAEWLALLASALSFGVLTSISPCPLATNVAAVSYLGKQVSQPKQSITLAAAYSAGRMVAYMLLASLLLSSALAAPQLSAFLQSQMNMLLGPVLLLVGLILAGIIRIPAPNWSLSSERQQRLASGGAVGSFGLGALFALSFCPTSAALFFASLLPLAMAQQSALLLPAVYGFGTALPVIIIALLLTFGSWQMAQIFSGISKFEQWLRRLSALIFIVAGGYYCVAYLLPQLR
ncbi:aromatic aminobenezylarsenical efflux permease ArsG family transporter [Ferrimonas senticii]|uniref:aromatic aminobenezylarsenical efflux permease ArsG family transporter n=1 Tax=Ferrimonas senticii TaxID=394566 RepID=UPI00042563CA|nr:aromatic aminobenezylarsenical efflux permease ArsG family transporter [Ferrimonas senticii]